MTILQNNILHDHMEKGDMQDMIPTEQDAVTRKKQLGLLFLAASLALVAVIGAVRSSVGRDIMSANIMMFNDGRNLLPEHDDEFDSAIGAEAVMGCNDDEDCLGDDEFCQFADGDCGTGGAGLCSAKASVCLGVESLVCGCDGETYSNECYAHSNGASIVSAGECCNDDDDCESGECKADGVCEAEAPSDDGGPF